MFNKVILCLGAICLIQVANCGPIEDLINELKPKIQEARLNVAKVVKDGGETIGTTYASIEKQISVLDQELDEQSHQLHESVKQAEADAKTTGKDISACVEQERAAEEDLSRKEFELCRISVDLNLLGLKVAEVAKLQVVLSKAPIVCVKNSGVDLERIRACIEDAVNTVNTKADEVGNQINTIADEAEAKALECANKNAEDLEDAIKTVSNNFNDCVSKA